MHSHTKKNPILIYGIVLCGLINILQATFTELHSDEAYYWLYAKFLDWGYFDHPPMVAIFIKIGELFGHHEITLRLLSIISSMLGIFFLWKTIKQQNPSANALSFWLLFGNFLLFQVYGFITTPDTPLLLGSILYFYLLYNYLENNKLSHILLLSLVIVFMLYSKYHAVLLLFFTIVSYPKILLRRNFYPIVLLSVAGYFPHIWWQIKHQYPTVQFHLFERNNNLHYEYWHTSNYILAQIAFGGLFLSYWVYTSVFKMKNKSPYERILWWNVIGILGFFFLSSFQSKVEAHWTLVAFVPLFILSYKNLLNNGIFQKSLFKKLAIAGILLVSLVRFVMVIPIPLFKKTPAVQMFFNNKAWANTIYKKIDGKYCLISNGFAATSYYDYYNNTLSGTSYSSKYYRKTQFDNWNLEDQFSKQKPLFITNYKTAGLPIDSVTTAIGEYYIAPLPDTSTFNKVNIELQELPKILNKGKKITVNSILKNNYQHTIVLDTTQNWGVDIVNNFGVWEYIPVQFPSKIRLKTNQNMQINFSFQVPDSLQNGNYLLFISLQNNKLTGTRNSRFYKIKIQ